MANFLIYRYLEGAPGERPVSSWGICQDGLETSQPVSAGERVTATGIDVTALNDEGTHYYNSGTDAISRFDPGGSAPIYDAAQSALEDIRRRLRDSDWAVLDDAPHNNYSAWANYRQALRSVRYQSGFPNTISWPLPPGDAEF